MDMDRELVGRLIRRQVDRDFGGVQELVRATGKGKAREVSRSRIYEAMDGDDSVTIKMWRRIETGLGFPFQTLELVATHRFDQLEAEGVPADVVSWLRKQVDSGSPAGGSAAM